MSDYALWNDERHCYEYGDYVNHNHWSYHDHDRDIWYEDRPQSEIKEIHFYAFEYEHAIHGYEETDKCIKIGVDLLKTTQMALLSFDLQDIYGYDIYVHDDPSNFQDCYLISYDVRQCERTDRQLRLAHNILKMWMAGEFDK